MITQADLSNPNRRIRILDINVFGKQVPSRHQGAPKLNLKPCGEAAGPALGSEWPDLRARERCVGDPFPWPGQSWTPNSPLHGEELGPDKCLAGIPMTVWVFLRLHGVVHSGAIQLSAPVLRPKGINAKINEWPASDVRDGMPGLSWWPKACLQTRGPGLRKSNLGSPFSPTVKNKQTNPYYTLELHSTVLFQGPLKLLLFYSELDMLHGSCIRCSDFFAAQMLPLTEDRHDLY